MKNLVAMVLFLTVSGTAALAAEETKEEERLHNAANVITEIMGTPENAIPTDLLKKAVCLGIIPSQKKGAFVIGVSYGRGCLICRRGGDGAWGAPSMFTVGGVNVGFQLGGEATDFVLVVMNAKGARKLLQSKSKLGADASAAAGPVGRTASGATDLQLQAEILTYSRSRGLFAGVSLEGAAVIQDTDSNSKLYGKKTAPKDILFTDKVPVPEAAQPLVTALTKYSPNGGQKFVD
jgi:lipid-binding SYLF domain-containing protein